MPELPFPDLATPAARETQPPPFERIVGRARRRRRRRVAAVTSTTAAALALAVGGTALTVGHRGASPSPTRPSPTSTAPAPSPVGSAADQHECQGNQEQDTNQERQPNGEGTRLPKGPALGHVIGDV